MPAYVIVEIEVLDPEGYARYRELAPPTVAAHGGRYIVRGGQTAILEGDWSPPRLAVLEFPSLERAKAWWASAEYAAARAVRSGAARVRMVAVEGI